MGCDVEISIFGKVSDPEKAWALARAAESEGLVNFVEAFDASEFVDMVRNAAQTGNAVTITRSDTTNFFEEVTSACWEADLAYVMHYGTSGAESFSSGTYWAPGLAREREFSLNDKGVTVELAAVRAAAAKGIEAVNELISRETAHTRIGKIEIEPGFEAKLEDYLASENAWGM